MKRIIYTILLLCAFTACKQEPQFPDPGLDLTRDVRDTVRRDTIDIYQLSMHIKAPNGVAQIQVLNGQTYEEIDNYTAEYAGKKDFTFFYDVDLRDIEVDTTLNFIVKVVDQDMRAYNKGFSLTVLKFSAPIITIGGVSADGRISLTNNYIMFKARFSTGMNTIKSYRLSLDGVEFDSHTYDTIMHEFIHKKGYVLEDMTVKNKDYTLRVEMADSKGMTDTKEVILRMMDLDRPIKVKMNAYTGASPQLIRELKFNYNKQNTDRLDWIDGLMFYYNMNGILTSEQEFKYEFIYNDANMVTEFRMTWANPASNRTSFSYLLTYDNDNRLTGWSGGASTSQKTWTVVDWLDDGRIKTFQRDESVNTWSWSYEDGLFAEYDLTKTGEGDRVRAVGVTTWAIPTFLSGLPSIEYYNPAFNSDILELLMYKNGFEKLIRGGVYEAGIYVYTADSKGRLLSMRRKAGVEAPAGREYIFEYAN